VKKPIRALLVFLVVFGGLVGAGWLVFDQALHLREDTVATGSMEPEFIPGSRVFIREGQMPHVNDVVAFHNPSTGGVTVHIFGGYNADGTLKTRGMANDDPDDFFPAPHRQDIIGVVTYHTEIFTRPYWFSYRGLGVILIFASAAALGIVAIRMGRAERKESGAVSEEASPSASTPA
jgi:hypothetical protein